MQYIFKSHKCGDTFEGITFTIFVNAVPVDLSATIIRMQLRSTPKSPDIIKEFSSIGDNPLISISNTVVNEFSIIEIDSLNPAPGRYAYDIEIDFSDGKIKTWIEGFWTFTADVTR